MNNRDVAIEYLTGFSEGDLDRINRVLADGFEFKEVIVTCHQVFCYMVRMGL